MSKRLKNYGVWMAILSQVVIMLTALGWSEGDISLLETLSLGSANILLVLGILNNPTDGSGFLDTKKEGDVE